MNSDKKELRLLLKELRFLLIADDNDRHLKYKNIIDFILDNKKHKKELLRIVRIIDVNYHMMYQDERKIRDNIKTLAKEKQALMDI